MKRALPLLLATLLPVALLRCAGGASASQSASDASSPEDAAALAPDGASPDAAAGSPDAGADAGLDAGSCKANGSGTASSCLSPLECCSRFCDPHLFECAEMPDAGGGCLPEGALCSTGAECCTGQCHASAKSCTR